MGGRGSKSSIGAGGSATGGSLLNAQNQQNNALNNTPIADQAPTPANTPVNPNGVSDLAKMTDDELTDLYNKSRNVDMPNHLSDIDNNTQKFVYQAGLNGKPQVLDNAAFDQYLKDNNIPRSQMLARTTGGADYNVNGTNIRLTPTQITSMIKDGELNYIGGKAAGKSWYGHGTYFDMNGGRPTGYGGGNTATCLGVLSKNANIISDSSLSGRAQSFMKSHPKFASAVGSYSTRTMSIYALAMGYNVIKAGSYHNVLDRTALVMRSNDY